MNLLKNITYFGVAVLLARVLGTLRVFVVAKIIGPSAYGEWITLLMLYSLGPILCLGAIETMLKDYPYNIGRGDIKEARRIEGGVLASVSLSSGLLMAVALSIAFFANSSWTSLSKSSFVTIAITSAAGFFSAFFYLRLAAHQNFRLVGFLEASRSLLLFPLLILSGFYLGLPGVISGFACTEAIILGISAWLSLKFCGTIRLDYSPTLLKYVIRTGLPITIVWWMFIIQTSLDRIMSFALLGKELTGYYGLGVNIYSAILLVPVIIGKVIYPKLNEEIGRDQIEKSVQELVVKPTRAFALLLPLAICFVAVILPVVYSELLPKYSKGLVSAFILMLGSYFVALRRNGTNLMLSTNHQKDLLKYIVQAVGINIAGNLLLIRMGWSIDGIAISTLVAAIFLTTRVLWRVFEWNGGSRREVMLKLITCYVPVVSPVAVIILIVFLYGKLSLALYLAVGFAASLFAASFLVFINPWRGWVGSAVGGSERISKCRLAVALRRLRPIWFR